MDRRWLLAFAGVVTLLAGASSDARKSPYPALTLICHGTDLPAQGVVRALLVSTLPQHLAHGDCSIPGAAVLQSACDRRDLDSDDICDAALARTCGDGAVPGGGDDLCTCGDTVVTNTMIEPGVDPVANTSCPGDGLTLAPGVQLTLDGATLTGSGTGNGLTVAGGGAVSGGTITGFGVGLQVAAATPDASVTITGTTLAGNTGDGAQVALTQPQARVVFDQVAAQGNADDGIHVVGAPGAANLDDPADRLEHTDYGFVLRSSNGIAPDVSGNGAYGIHLGDATQPSDVAALVEGSNVHANQLAGIVLEQAASVVPGADCGASAGYPGCTGATILANNIYDNGGSGLQLGAGFIIPRYVPAVEDRGLGFDSNRVAHNAMASAGCVGEQSAPQISVTGPVGLDGAACAAAQTAGACGNANVPLNRHCLWTGTACRVSWDLRGDVDASCASGISNVITSYNTSDVSALSVGLRATGGAIVWGEHNEWRSSLSSQNVSQSADAFVGAESTCGTRSMCEF